MHIADEEWIWSNVCAQDDAYLFQYLSSDCTWANANEPNPPVFL